jgi:hypothetical protein
MMKMKAGLHDWEMNLIQGMVSQLQVDYRALKTSNKGKKNQINTTYKVMEVSVELCAQLLDFGNNLSINPYRHRNHSRVRSIPVSSLLY